jgi:deazaflavin-dependent oxidoreductase (nitroreductase family)
MRNSNLFGEEHVRKYEETGGKVGHDWNDTHVLILHTTGRKSGKERKNPLIYGRVGGDYLIVASRGGAPDHPDWYLNLTANPNTEIQVWGELIPVTARTATPDEKARLWKTMTEQWPDYDSYQQRTERDIPLVILSPRSKG